MMTYRQKEIYAEVVAKKKYAAKGRCITTCKVLMQLGLIMHDPNSKEVHVYVLNGRPMDIPFNEKLPFTKDIVKAISEPSAAQVEIEPITSAPKHKPIIWSSRPSKAIYSNASREQHVAKWLGMPVKVQNKKYTPVKCLEEWHMEYIMENYQQKTAREMADHLGKERYEVILFCQANVIEPKTGRKIKDSYHQVPIERQQRMSRQGYNGTENKTA